MKNILNLYTDGGCSGNQNDVNFGGWGAILEYGEKRKEIYGSEINTTNNRMELTAVISGLKALRRFNLTVNVYTDSSYVSECFRQKWYLGWEKNGWINSQKNPVENEDLWKTLLPLVRSIDNVYFHRVKGHVNINHPNTNLEKIYKKFCEWNGNNYTMKDFIYITKMNNRADELANIGINEIKNKKPL